MRDPGSFLMPENLPTFYKNMVCEFTLLFYNETHAIQKERPMKTILTSSTLFWNGSLEEMFDRVYEQGYFGIELWAQHFFEKGYEEEAYYRLASLYPLQTYVHSCSWDLNLASMNREIRQASLEAVIASMELAKRLGSYEVTVHPGHMTMEGSTEQYIENMKQPLNALAEVSEQLKVDVSLEIMEQEKKEFVTDMEMMRRITGDLFEAFHYTLDTAHCSSVEEIFRNLEENPGISKIHISNRKEGKLHTPLGQGDYDFRALLPRLLSYGIPLVVEGYDDSADFKIFKENSEFLKENGGI